MFSLSILSMYPVLELWDFDIKKNMLYGKAAELVLYLLFKPDADVVKVYRLKKDFLK